MWESYKRSFLRTQVMVLAVTAALYWFLKIPPQVVLAAFVLMQIGGLLGAWFGVRLRRSIQKQERRSGL